jgi:hypothetical protein
VWATMPSWFGTMPYRGCEADRRLESFKGPWPPPAHHVAERALEALVLTRAETGRARRRSSELIADASSIASDVTAAVSVTRTAPTLRRRTRPLEPAEAVRPPSSARAEDRAA